MINALMDEQIEEVLKHNLLGRIGCNDGKKNYVVPVNYVYDGQFIIAHSVEGMKIRMMRANPDICFQVDEIKNFASWKSVIVWGQYQELTDERSRLYAMKLFVDKMLREKISKTAIPHDIDNTKAYPQFPGNMRAIIYRIVISEKTGRFENDDH